MWIYIRIFAALNIIHHPQSIFLLLTTRKFMLLTALRDISNRYSNCFGFLFSSFEIILCIALKCSHRRQLYNNTMTLSF